MLDQRRTHNSKRTTALQAVCRRLQQFATVSGTFEHSPACSLWATYRPPDPPKHLARARAPDAISAGVRR
eukprot:5691257-Alexandrium_andersonii.AAC.1